MLQIWGVAGMGVSFVTHQGVNVNLVNTLR